ncbi:anti-sigma factor [Pedobacter sp. HMWF019]|uniref:FecR family protein n=1 Tax=Pedobacter sp. HMWF019 TaxID=2056856 RepID=UPI000D38AADF|nr:FecR family protein [Pedobacter sp. HMWF019]PTS99302.1 anti-sigma factor [Pedobacter sp. HMWF019]
MPQNEAEEIFEKYNAGLATEEEKALLETWYLIYKKEGNNFSASELIEDQDQSIESLLVEIGKRKPLQLWPRVAVAAAILIVCAFSIYLFTEHSAKENIEMPVYANDIAAGSNKAILTLSDGSKISLTDAANGKVSNLNGIMISKTADGQLIYTISGSANPTDRSKLNTISTPRGGQWQVRLPDGTQVWLNAASAITYPVSFNGSKERRVELSGEAYFEVSKNKEKPFIVKSLQQEVKVLGTHFNINSYTNETAVKTTLMEGKVLINGRTELKPGEQAVLLGTTLNVMKADTELAMAWKNNKFMFDQERIENIMRMIERWYNVEVVYQGQIPEDKFGGSVSRFDQVSKVLSILELTGKVHFKIEGRRITVTK